VLEGLVKCDVGSAVDDNVAVLHQHLIVLRAQSEAVLRYISVDGDDLLLDEGVEAIISELVPYSLETSPIEDLLLQALLSAEPLLPSDENEDVLELGD